MVDVAYPHFPSQPSTTRVPSWNTPGLHPGIFRSHSASQARILGPSHFTEPNAIFLIFALCWIFSIFKYDAFIVMMMMVIVCCVCYVDCMMMMMHNVALVSSGISTTRVNEYVQAPLQLHRWACDGALG